MNGVPLRSVEALIGLCSPDAEEAIENAKVIIAQVKSGNFAALVQRIAEHRKMPLGSRVAATYSLGFLTGPSIGKTLISILSSSKEPDNLRDHAAEALGNRRETRAVDTLIKVGAGAGYRSRLRKSCVYALRQIGGRRAEQALKRLNAR